MKKKLLTSACLSLTLSSLLLSGCSDKVDDGMKETSVGATETVGFAGDSNVVDAREEVIEETTTSSLQSLNKPLESEIKEVKEDKKVAEVAKIDLVNTVDIINPLYEDELGEEKQYDYFKLALPISNSITYAGIKETNPITNSIFYQGDIENYKNFVLCSMSSIDFVSEGLIEDGEVVNFDELEEEERINYLKKFKLEGVDGMTPYNVYSFENKSGLPFHVIDFVDSDGLCGSVAYSIKNNICFINMAMSDISIHRASDFNYFLTNNAIYNMEPVSDELNISFDGFNDEIQIENKSLDGFEKKVLIEEFMNGSLTINEHKFTIGETTVEDIEKFNYTFREVDEDGVYYEFAVDDSNRLVLGTLGESADSKLNFINLDYHISNDNSIECNLIPWLSTLDDVKGILNEQNSEFMDIYSFELNNNVTVDITIDYYLNEELVSNILMIGNGSH